jgi:hypothetical protein
VSRPKTFQQFDSAFLPFLIGRGAIAFRRRTSAVLQTYQFLRYQFSCFLSAAQHDGDGNRIEGRKEIERKQIDGAHRGDRVEQKLADITVSVNSLLMKGQPL